MHRSDAPLPHDEPPPNPADPRSPHAPPAIPTEFAPIPPELRAQLTAAFVKPRHLSSLLLQDALSLNIARERARSDRSGRAFSLVVFRVPSDSLSLRNMHRLALAAIRKCRVIDDVGWFSNDAIAALLPETPSAGAWTFAHAIVATVRAHIPQLHCSVFTHPFDLSSPSTGAPDSSTPVSSTPASTPLPGAHSVTLAASSRYRPSDLPANPVASLFARPLPAWKRALDVVGALAGLTLAAPLFLAAAAAIKLTDRGPILFSQPRAGLAGRPFTMYKFRSMYTDAEARKAQLMHLNEQDGPAFKIKNDPRVTPVGRLLRKTSIDELPQLLNVLKGEMSLVGPRPLPIDEQAAAATWQQRRLDVTPGLTCIWQIRGRSALVSFEEWTRMDIAYARAVSLWFDLKLIFATVPAMVSRKGH